MVFEYYYSKYLSLQLEEDVLADISIPNTSLYKIIDIIRTVDEWSDIVFSDRQNAENEHCETLKKVIHKFHLHKWTCLYKTLNVGFVYYYSSNQSLHSERGAFADISNPNTCISIIIDIIRTVDEWAEIAFSPRQYAENDHCETLK